MVPGTQARVSGGNREPGVSEVLLSLPPRGRFFKKSKIP